MTATKKDIRAYSSEELQEFFKEQAIKLFEETSLSMVVE
jgi:hypothetical protein